MYLNSEKKKEVFAANGFKKSATDTGSAESQVALFTLRINALTEHLKQNKKDHSTRRGLLMLVGKRKKMLGHLSHHPINIIKAMFLKLLYQLLRYLINSFMKLIL